MQGMQIQVLGWEDPLEKEMITHSSTLAWEILWTEERGGLQSMRSQRAGHDLEKKQQQMYWGGCKNAFRRQDGSGCKFTTVLGREPGPLAAINTVTRSHSKNLSLTKFNQVSLSPWLS